MSSFDCAALGKSLLMDVDDKSAGKCSSFNSEVEQKKSLTNLSAETKGPLKTKR